MIKQLKVQQPSIKIDYEAFTFMGTLVEDILRLPKTLWSFFKNWSHKKPA
jgi:hypothetical protein